MKTTLLLLMLLVGNVFAQTETLTNADIIEMTQATLSKELILDKIQTSNGLFDVKTKALIELKNAGVSDDVISAMIAKSKAKRQRYTQSEEKNPASKALSESNTTTNFGNQQTPAELLRNARTIAIKKSSLHPARQNLEKSLLSNPDWKSLNLSITEYEETADLYIDIGRIPMSWLTLRYVYRVYDTRSGALIAAGESTAWGSLAENLAKHIVKKLKETSNQQ